MELLTSLFFLQGVLEATWRMATPIIYASVGEAITERAGVLNIGLEGVMLIGAFAGYAAAYETGSLLAGLLAAVFSGVMSGLIFAFFTITIKANQIVVGAAFNMIGLGITGFLYRSLFSVGRELDRQPRFLLVNQPTRGIDIGATAFVRQEIIAARDRGAAILLISTDLEEILALSDRVLVMFGGRIVGEASPDPAQIEHIGLLMAGQTGAALRPTAAEITP